MQLEIDSPKARLETRILLLPPTSRDAQAVREVLATAGLQCTVSMQMRGLCQELEAGAGAIVVSEEALLADPAGLSACVRAQPIWSDLPIVLLSRWGAESPALAGLLAGLGNVSVLERPVRITTLLSVVRSCLRARERQYELRDHFTEREQLLSSERAARSDAERSSKIKDEFLATLSHELRTPLNAILGWSHILTMGNSTANDVEEGIRVIARNARAQAQIIDDLLDMSRIISGKIRLEVDDVELAELLQAALATVRPAADAKAIRLTLDLDLAPSKTRADPNRLQQILWNLLSNAVKFTPRGGTVHVWLQRCTAHWEIGVQDSGEGIDREFLPHVFDRFRQANSTTTRTHGGLGLGLAIVKQLIELHGGSVRALSQGVGKGSTFIVRLPFQVRVNVHEPQHDLFGQPRPARTEASASSIEGLKVLVVDDDVDARTMLQRLLEEHGARVILGESAKEGLSLLESDGPDILVSDIGMAGEDGYSLIRNVRKLPPERGGKVPALALTAYARAEDRMNALHAGFQDHLSKPVTPAELVSLIGTLANRCSD